MTLRRSLAIEIVFTMFLMSVPAQTTGNAVSDFTATFRREVKDAGIVGGSFVFLRNNNIVASEHVGFVNEATKLPVAMDTIYHWASNTKPFTGIAIMQLRDRGLLRLDDPVTKYLPELRAVHNPFGSMDEITIRQLMTHS